MGAVALTDQSGRRFAVSASAKIKYMGLFD